MLVVFHPFERESLGSVTNGCRKAGIPLVCGALRTVTDKVFLNEDSDFIRCACIDAAGWSW